MEYAIIRLEEAIKERKEAKISLENDLNMTTNAFVRDDYLSCMSAIDEEILEYENAIKILRSEKTEA